MNLRTLTYRKPDGQIIVGHKEYSIWNRTDAPMIRTLHGIDEVLRARMIAGASESLKEFEEGIKD